MDKVLKRLLTTEDHNGDVVNITDGLFAIAAALRDVAEALIRLGFNNACTPMGAIETLSLEVKNAGERIAESINNLANTHD